MIGKIITLPFWIAWKAIGAVFAIFRLGVRTGFGLFRFVSNRRLGTVAVIVIGFLLGKKYLDGKTGAEKKNS
jgi:hypothetical protein